MSAQKASAPVRFARLAAAAVLVVLAAAVVIRLLDEGGGAPAEALKPPPEDRVVDVKEQVRHEEYRDGRLRAAIRGDAFFLGPDGRKHLKGSVEVLAYGAEGAVDSRTTADEVVYGESTDRFVITGRVRVEAGGFVLEGSSFDYDKEAGIFRTAAGGTFSSGAMSGRAAEVSYFERAGEVRLAGGFLAEMAAAGRDGETGALSGDSLLYRGSGRSGRADGEVVYVAGRCRGSARAMEFRAAEDMGYLESAAFDGKAEVVLSRMEPGNAGSGEISADRIEVSFLPAAGGPSSVGSRGSARMTLRSETGARTAVQAAEIDLRLGKGGELVLWSASGGSLAERVGGAADRLVLEGDSLTFEASSGVLRVLGGPARPAAAESPGARVEAASVAAGPAEGDLDAEGGVKCLLKRRGEDRGDGFFSGDEPVYVSSASLSVRAASRIYSFAGDVQAWQGKEFLLAGELDYQEGTGEMKGRGGTAAGMTQAAGEGPGRRIEIGGVAMAFSPAGRALVFKERAYVQWPGARLEAGSVSAVLAPGGEGAESLTARTGVVLSKGRYEGRGDAAVYSAGTDRIVLTGNPVLVDREGGSTRGDKLTFEMGDGKILVENEGQGRSTTVIKS